MKRRIALTALASLAFAALGTFPVTALAQTPIYSVRNLGPLGSGDELDTVTAMSSDGTKMVGSAETIKGTSATTNAFYWDGTMHKLYTMGSTNGLGISPAPVGVTPTGLVLIGTVAQPAVWTPAGGTVLLPFPSTTLGYHVATSVNDEGVVVGMGPNPDVYLVDNGGTAYMSSALRWSLDESGSWTYQELQPLAGDNSCWIRPAINAIDQSGNIFGQSNLCYLDGNGNLASTVAHCVRWSPSDGFTPHDLGPLPSSAQSVIAFDTDPTTLTTQFVWNIKANAQAFYSYPTTANTIQLVGTSTTSPSASAQGVNILGQVAGNANFTGGSDAFYWDTTFSFGAVLDLGVLAGMTGSQVAIDFGIPTMNIIDDGGFIVGDSTGYTKKEGNISKAFLSTPASRTTAAKLLDLNTLLTPNALSNAGLSSLTQGLIINDAGFIACHGVDAKTGYQRVVILTRVQ